jgi:hypothetical protein
MQSRLIQKLLLGVVVLVFGLALAKRRRAGKPTKRELVDLVSAGAGILTLVPLVFDLPVPWSLPFFLTAFALMVLAFRRPPSSGGAPPSDNDRAAG